MHDIFLMLGHFYLFCLFLVVEQCFPLPQLALCGADPKSAGLNGDLPAWKGFWSGTEPARSHPYRGFPHPPVPHPLLCGLGTRKCLVNLEEIFRKSCAERWRLRAL